jgi:hypothetical protein
VEQGYLDALISTCVGVGSGQLPASALALKFAQVSGLGIDESAGRAAVVMGAYQAQADEALASRSGIEAADLPDFYAWCKANHRGDLQEAMQKQVRMHDVQGYTALASRWLATVPPSLQALKAAGLPVRTLSRTPEVYLQGQWMTPGAAALAGLI